MEKSNAYSPLRILVADDSLDTVMTLRMLLEDDGHMVHTLTSGAGVVAAVGELKPNVCIVDIHMPGATGYEVGSELKRRYGSARPYMIAISGKSYRASDMLTAKQMGFDHFFEKPADPRQLARLLAEVQQRLAA